ncbi:MAG: lysophospholipid acyltransferase family protein [Anaerolineales bacterium]|jgi:1-acyl-sn-glycerol-3-phosphate acyltransferase
MIQVFLYMTSLTFVRLFALVMLRLDVRRHGSLPSGPMIFVANHPSATDPFLIHMISRNQLNVMITVKAFKVPIFGWFLRKVQEIPVPLTQGRAALEQARRHIDQGRSVAIFIEGHISPLEGGFLPPRSGAARLALSTGAPVVPVGIYLYRERCHNIRSRITGGVSSEARWYLREPYAITIGQPTQYEGNAEDHEHVDRVSESIMDRIRALAHESEGRIQGGMLVPAPI